MWLRLLALERLKRNSEKGKGDATKANRKRNFCDFAFVASPFPFSLFLFNLSNASNLNHISIVSTLNDCLLPALNPSLHKPNPKLQPRCKYRGFCFGVRVAFKHQSLSFAIKCSATSFVGGEGEGGTSLELPLATPRCRCSKSKNRKRNAEPQPSAKKPTQLHFFNVLSLHLADNNLPHPHSHPLSSFSAHFLSLTCHLWLGCFCCCFFLLFEIH